MPGAASRTPWQSFAAMLGVSLVFMLNALNISVVGTAMPRVVAELQGFALYPWTATGFLMANAVTIPITGRLGDLYGRKPFLLWATVLFALSSAACGLAIDMLQLVLARAMQGVAGGMIVGVTSASLADLFPDRTQRVRWQVMLASSFGIAQAVGPWLGGWLTEHLGWRYVFFVNLPVALLALPVVWRYLPRIVHHEGDDRSIDWMSAALLMVTIASLMTGAEFTQAWGLIDWRTLAAAALAATMGTVFVRHQYRTSAPIVPTTVLDNAGARKLMMLGLLTGLTMFLLVFYAPLLLQGALGQSPDRAGIVMTPLLLCITMGSIVNGRLLPRLRRAERIVVWGQFGLMAGCLLLARLDEHMSQSSMMAIFALCGVSLGFQLPNLTLQMMELAGPKNTGVASSLIHSTRTVGSMIGVGIASVLVNTLYTQRVTEALARLHVSDATVQRLLASPQVLVRAQDRQQLLEQAQRLSLDATPLLAAAREGLASGIHMAFLACALIAGACALISLDLPHYEIRRSTTT